MSSQVLRRVRRWAVTAVAVFAMAAVLAPATAGAASSKVDKKGVLKMALNFNDLGGAFFWPGRGPTNPAPAIWMDQIYDVMIRPTADGKGAPGLATKWETPDASTVVLTLRDGVKFSDGTPFTAAAVKAAWDSLIALKPTGLAPEILAISSVEVAGNVVTLKLSQPQAEVLTSKELRSAYWLGVPSPASVAAGTVNTKPIGAGPYLLESYTTNQLVTLKPNPQFYDTKQQLLAGIDFVQTATGAPSVSALQAGTVNLMRDVPFVSIDAINGTKGLEVQPVTSSDLRSLNLCPSKAPFDNKTARQALTYALDREAINQAAFAGLGTTTSQMLTTLSPFYNKKYTTTFKYDPKKAKALLAEAGVASGTTVALLAPNSEPYPAIVDVVSAQLKAIGLNVSPTITANFSGDTRLQQPPLIVTLGSPGFFQLQLGTAPSALNQCAWQSQVAKDGLTVGQDPSKTTAERQKGWDTYVSTLQEEAVILPIVQVPNVLAHTTKVKGITVADALKGPVLFGVYISK